MCNVLLLWFDEDDHQALNTWKTVCVCVCVCVCVVCE